MSFDPLEGSLVIKIPKQIWSDEAGRNWNLELDKDALRDDDGDIVMDLSDSHDYVNLLLGHSHRERFIHQSELNAMAFTTQYSLHRGDSTQNDSSQSSESTWR